MARKFTFRGGISSPSEKIKTENLSIEELPAPPKIILPVSFSNDILVKSSIKRGDRVLLGQLISDPNNPVTPPVYSSVSGTVISTGLIPSQTGTQISGIEIENDGTDECVQLDPFEKSWRESAPGELIKKIQSSGVIAMSGEGNALNLSPPSNKPIDTVIINGIGIESCLTSELRLMIERSDNFLTGVAILKKILGAKRCLIGIREKNSSVIQALKTRLSDQKYKDISFSVIQMKYPQGHEKQLIETLINREVPSGGQAEDIGCAVFDVSTAVAIFDSIIEGIPLYKRVVTVCGPAIKSPKNLSIRLGTPIRYLLEYCGIDINAARKVVIGGPMTGLAQSNLDVPIIGNSTGLYVYDKTVPPVREYPCINCGRCVAVCPIHLIPSKFAGLVEKNKIDEAAEWNMMDCTECGCCSYVCPSKVNIVHFVKLGKFHIEAKRAVAN